MQEANDEYPTLREWLVKLKALDQDSEFVLSEGKLLLTRTGQAYPPEKVRVTGMHHIQGEGASPSLLFLVQTTDGRRGWVAEMADGGPSQGLSLFIDRVLAESNRSK